MQGDMLSFLLVFRVQIPESLVFMSFQNQNIKSRSKLIDKAVWSYFLMPYLFSKKISKLPAI